MLPEVSIIVPLYNCGKPALIERLVSCIISQTEKSWELLLCNDGSTDCTLEICRNIENRDSRIRVFDCEHRGVSATRNTGIQNSKGKWLTFIDSDDIVTSVFLESMLTAASHNEKTDLVCCSYIVMDRHTAQVNLYSDNIFAGNKEIANLFDNTSFLHRCSPWARMFRSDLVNQNGLLFDTSLSHSEDRLFVYNYLLHTDTIATTSSVGYFYGSFSSGSLKHAKYSIKTLFHRQDLLTRAAFSIIERFNLRADHTFCVSNNLLNLFKDTAENIALFNKQTDTGIHSLKQFKDSYFPVETVAFFNSDPRFKEGIQSDIRTQYLFSNKLEKYIRLVRKAALLIKFKQRLRNLLGIKPYPADFDTYIKKLN